jgi:hypothetical protein
MLADGIFLTMTNKYYNKVNTADRCAPADFFVSPNKC